ncbi:hypothetical protein L6452_40069 [Arctium lappa]|uniref:Uncharacterized protein n=1 Tax=Arctium lappa TaxID=4217 RepID=A0ACB8XY87_ARCLA|nr:hypothetical protein L6452_40069 [Arctium lappa]
MGLRRGAQIERRKEEKALWCFETLGRNRTKQKKGCGTHKFSLGLFYCTKSRLFHAQNCWDFEFFYTDHFGAVFRD